MLEAKKPQYSTSLESSSPASVFSDLTMQGESANLGRVHPDVALEIDSAHTSHKEPHFDGAEIIRDIVIGLSDGLTVPFALAAGLASLNSSRLVVTAGMAEIVAGSISMGLGGFLAGLSEIEHYDAERLREIEEVETVPLREQAEIYEIFEPFGISQKAVAPMIEELVRDKESWINFMMKFELCLEKPSKHRTWVSALTIGFAYFCGGLVPLIPYMLISVAETALWVSAIVTVAALFIFGYTKAKLQEMPRPLFSGIQMAFIGSAAAAAAFGIAKAIPQQGLAA